MADELCELGKWKGLQNAPETCRCVHKLTIYRAPHGVRCKCCFGLVVAAVKAGKNG